jgi:photosystem II protein
MRCTVLGIATAIIGELITGKGALGQLGLETGVPITELEPLILAGIAFNLVRTPRVHAGTQIRRTWAYR